MKLLLSAVAKGFKDAATLKKNSDLDQLRDHEDFQKLLEESEAGWCGNTGVMSGTLRA
jgi:hypothetical protein